MIFDIFFNEYIRELRQFRKTENQKRLIEIYSYNNLEIILIGVAITCAILSYLLCKHIPDGWTIVLMTISFVCTIFFVFIDDVTIKRRKLSKQYRRDLLQIFEKESIESLHKVFQLTEFSKLNNCGGVEWLLNQTETRIAEFSPKISKTGIMGAFVSCFLYPYILIMYSTMATGINDTHIYINGMIMFIIVFFVSLGFSFLLVAIDRIKRRELLLLIDLKESLDYLRHIEMFESEEIW